MTAPTMRDEFKKTAKYILFKHHCHREDGEFFYDHMVQAIESALSEIRERTIEECAEVINKGTPMQSYWSFGPERLKQEILKLKGKA